MGYFYSPRPSGGQVRRVKDVGMDEGGGPFLAGNGARVTPQQSRMKTQTKLTCCVFCPSFTASPF